RQDEQDRHDRGDGYADRDSLECTARGLSQQRLQQPERIAGDMDTEERARTGGQGDQDRVESDDRRHGREDARRRDRGDGHGTDRDVQSRGDEPHHEQRGGRAGGEVLAKDVAETGRLDGGGQRAAHAGEDQDLTALLEPGGYRVLNRLGTQRVAADEARAYQADQQGDDGRGDELDDRVVDVCGIEDR